MLLYLHPTNLHYFLRLTSRPRLLRAALCSGIWQNLEASRICCGGLQIAVAVMDQRRTTHAANLLTGTVKPSFPAESNEVSFHTHICMAVCVMSDN